MVMNTENPYKATVQARAAAVAMSLGLVLSAWQSAAWAGPREQAKRLHDRITGVPPTAAVLNQMEAAMSDPIAAARIATSQSAFYNVTLKNFAAPWTNRDQSAFVPLNDYTATIIGIVRDQDTANHIGFNEILSADILYVGSGASGIPGYVPYSLGNNAHYEFLDNNNVDLSAVLQRTTQSAQPGGLPTDATAGIMTTRAAAKAFFVAGTNRAMFRFTMLNHLCHDLEQVQDTSRAPDRIRQDVSRSPGGDSRLFLNGCVGCHAGMDPLAQAFARYNFVVPANGGEDDGQIQYTPTSVQAKYTINPDTFLQGYITPDDRWENRWREGPNQVLGWPNNNPPRIDVANNIGAGQGAKSMGMELANSDAFAKCQVEKVFRRVCFRSPSDSADRSEVNRIVGIFQSQNYSLKRVFQETGVYCMGQ
jgi:hypothetical protein